MKTPIKELIEFMQKKYNILRKDDLGTGLEIGDCIEYAESMLEKEKEVIMNAFLDGYTHSPDDGFPEYARNYYNETFNAKEK